MSRDPSKHRVCPGFFEISWLSAKRVIRELSDGLVQTSLTAPRDHGQMVYFARAENGLVKIGLSGRPVARVKKLSLERSSKTNKCPLLSPVEHRQGLLWSEAVKGEWFRGPATERLLSALLSSAAAVGDETSDMDERYPDLVQDMNKRIGPIRPLSESGGRRANANP
jgi:hypothetical protein